MIVEALSTLNVRVSPSFMLLVQEDKLKSWPFVDVVIVGFSVPVIVEPEEAGNEE